MTDFFQYLVAGLAVGCTYALLGSGFVIIYRVTQVVNFAQGTFAVLGGFFTYSLLSHAVPQGLAEVLGVLAAAATGGLFGLVALSRRGISPLASLVITLGLAIAAYAVETIVWGAAPISFDGLGGTLTIGGVQLSGQYLLVMLFTVVAFAGLALFFSRSYIGKGLTACSNNPFAARVSGINVWRMGVLSFAAGGLLGGLAGVLITPLQPSSFDSDIALAVSGFTAAIFGGLVSFQGALAGGVALGVVESMVAGYWNASYQTMVALVMVLAVLSVRAARHPDQADTETIAWSGTPGGRLLQSTPQRAVVLAGAAAVAALLPLWLNVSDLTVYVLTGLYAIAAIGLSLFMGYAGQISAGQAAFFAIGAYTAAVMSLHGLPTVAGVVVGTAVSALIAALIAVPVLRLKGNYLALATLAFQLIVLALIENINSLGGAVGLEGIPTLQIGGVQLSSLRSYAWLVFVVLALVVLVSRNLVRSRPGRGLRALATSEVAASSSGVRVARYKVGVFALAAAYAGLAGALYAYFIRSLAVSSFPVTLSIEFIVMIAVGGLGTIGGALAGVVGISVLLQWLANLGSQPGMPSYMPSVLTYAAYGLLLVVVVRMLPGGLVEGVDRLARLVHRSARKGAATGSGAGDGLGAVEVATAAPGAPRVTQDATVPELSRTMPAERDR